MKNHNFVQKKNDDRAPEGMSVWHCAKCDTEAIFDNRHTKFDVNKMMSEKMACLPPIHVRN